MPIEAGLGAIPLARLDRDDVAEWIEGLAAGGQLSRRSVPICRTVLRAALSEAVDEGLISRSPAARVALPRTVVKAAKIKEVQSWEPADVRRFLESTIEHRWFVGFRLSALYGLRRSELLALKWDDLDAKASTLRIDESLVATSTGAAWSNARNEPSRRRIPLDDETLCALKRRRSEQATERLIAGPTGRTTSSSSRHGRAGWSCPGHTIEHSRSAVAKAGVPRLTSHGLRHTAATHMVANSTDSGSYERSPTSWDTALTC